MSVKATPPKKDYTELEGVVSSAELRPLPIQSQCGMATHMLWYNPENFLIMQYKNKLKSMNTNLPEFKDNDTPVQREIKENQWAKFAENVCEILDAIFGKGESQSIARIMGMDFEVITLLFDKTSTDIAEYRAEKKKGEKETPITHEIALATAEAELKDYDTAE